MDNEDRRLTVNGVTVLAAALAIGASARFLVPQMQHAKAAIPLFLTVSWVSILGGAVAGLAAYAVAAALERHWLTWKAAAFAASLMAAVLAVNISLAGWVHLFDGLSKTPAFLPHGLVGGAETLTFEGYRSAIVKDRAAYHNQLGSLHYPAVLSLKALAAPDGLKNARTVLKQVRIVVTTYQDNYQQQEKNLRTGSIAGAITPEQQRAGMKRLESVMGVEFRAREDWWDTTAKIVAEQDALLADLADSDAAWEIKGDRITFHSKKDIGRFQTHMATLNALQEQAHTLDLKIAHESDKADEAMFNVRAGGIQEPHNP